MSVIPKPADKNATKPIYIVAIQGVSKDDLTFIKTRQDFFNIYENHIDIRGIVITKTEANRLRKATEIDRSLGEKSKQISWIIPIHQWVRTENISFNGLA